VGCDENAPRTRVDAQEEFPVVLRRFGHRSAVDLSVGAPSHGIPIGDRLPRRVRARPGEGGRGSDLTDPRGNGASDRAGAGEPSMDLVHRDDAPDRLPVEFGGRLAPQNKKGGVGSRVRARRCRQDRGPEFIGELEPFPFREVSPGPVAYDRSLRKGAHDLWGSAAVREPGDQRGIAPRFGRDVRVQAHEARFVD